MFSEDKKQIIVELHSPLLSSKGVKLLVQREDMNDSDCMGNKWWKLKYNLSKAIELKNDTVVTFGGAFSNHIVATASACQRMGLNSIGIIRGEESSKQNPTLKRAASFGMKFKFIDREYYRRKESVDWSQEYQNSYIVPEGGTNELAVKGCAEMLQDVDFDTVCVPVGTGGTLSGIVNALKGNQFALGFSSLKGGVFLIETINEYASSKNWKLNTDYHFRGYAKISEELITFMNAFKEQHSIVLDPVYTAKMFYGIFDMLKRDLIIPNSTILAIHTGGTQGIEGMNERIKSKGWKIDF
ncbi:MAG: pyridoxal-phosphate dependent enzyme [Flavobacteriales bacterium]|nr:pyridoxal-phosphate dependent enzyme [Flavobacteriales bacterium]